MGTEKYDIAVLGAGPGGYVAAIRASQLGKKVCIIEKDKPGGVCLNMGCIPTKTLIHQAELFESLNEIEQLGVKFDITGFDYAKAHKKSRQAAESLSKGVDFLLKKNGIVLKKGTGRITAKECITLESGEPVKADNIIIAAGSGPRELPGFEFDEKLVLSSNGILLQNFLPESMIILGAGAIGSEFAYILSCFGVKIYLVEMMDQILPAAERECDDLVAASLKKKKVEIFTNAKALSLKKENKGISIVIDHNGAEKTIKSDQLLAVTGRIPNTDGIGLENAGIKTSKGFIPVNDYYETSVPGIYAIGDVISSPLLAHVASKEGEIAAEHIAGLKTETMIDINLVPSAVYTNPGVASFGSTEKDLKDLGIKYKSFTFPYRGAGKTVAINKKDGFVKVHCDSATNEILGAHIAGEQAGELIHELLLAKKAELLPYDIASMIHAHPSISETVMEVMRGIEGWAVHI